MQKAQIHLQHYSYSLALRIWHPNIDPAVISGNLGLTPKHLHAAGFQRATPKGQQLGGTHAESYWHADPFGRGEYSSIEDRAEDVLADALEILKPHGSFLRLLREQGGRLHLQLSTFGAGNYAIELPPALLAACAGLGLSLVHDIYAVRQHG